MSARPKTVRELVRYTWEYSAVKRGLGDPVDYADAQINAMTNVELLESISDAIDELLEDRLSSHAMTVPPAEGK